MEIGAIKKKLSLLPYLHFVINMNPLSERAKKDFNSDWDYYFSFEFGWLIWHKNY